MTVNETQLLNSIKWSSDGLVPAIAQESATGRVLMMAWMNADALRETAASGHAVYWSRSRQRLWRKGETSGNQQRVVSLQLDCDGDTILLEVEQGGRVACHTGRNSCFFRRWTQSDWETTEPVLIDPDKMYS